MVLRFTLGPALVALSLAACVQLNRTGQAPDASPDSAAPTPDATAADLPPAPPPDAPASDRPPPVDSAPSPDAQEATPTECTPRAIGCSSDNRSVRTCNDQGRWTVTATCAAQTTCSAGVCLCSPEVCDEGTFRQIAAMPGRLVGDVAGGGGSLFVGMDGTPSSIRRIDLQSRMETVVTMGGPDFSAYALDADAMGNLIWCSDVHTSMSQTGDLFYGATRLATGSCTEVRRRDNLVYYKGDFLYRIGLDGSSRQMITSDAMERFEIAGDSLYFVSGKVGEGSFLKRLSLADASKVDTLVSRPDAYFRALMVDPAQVYVLTEDEILRIAQEAGAQPESFWQNAIAQVWAMAQTDSHLYWSTTTASPAGGCSQAEVWRKPKAGGTATVISMVQGHCAGDLVVVGQYLYTALGVTPPGAAPTEVLRIRL
jgi:hypothetical protein